METQKVVNSLLISILSLVLATSMANDGNVLNAVMNHPATLAIDKSLVEREQERIEADCATPEASPSATPFSLSRPMLIVSEVPLAVSTTLTI